MFKHLIYKIYLETVVITVELQYFIQIFTIKISEYDRLLQE